MPRLKLKIVQLIEKYRFLAIMMFAAIPNPLFDLAGVVCGHMLVPFWTFFGATVIGKAFIKVLLQSSVVIASVNQTLVTTVLEKAPTGQRIRGAVYKFLENQRLKLRPGEEVSENWLSWIFGYFVLFAVAYFALSIVNSLAQNHLRRRNKIM